MVRHAVSQSFLAIQLFRRLGLSKHVSRLYTFMIKLFFRQQDDRVFQSKYD